MIGNFPREILGDKGEGRPGQPAIVIEPTHNDATLNEVNATTAAPDDPLLLVAETLTFEFFLVFFWT